MVLCRDWFVRLILPRFISSLYVMELSPKNKIVREGGNVTLHCSTTTPGHGITWTYQRENTVDDIIHPLDYEETVFGHRLKIIKTSLVNYWDFALQINDVKIYDAGVFTCINAFNYNKSSAMVNVVQSPMCSCSSTHARTMYECMISFSVHSELEERWTCNVPDEALFQTNLKSIGEMIHPITGVGVPFNELATSVTLRRTVEGLETLILSCNLTIRNSIDEFIMLDWAVNMDIENVHFEMTLFPVMNVRFNISDGYNLRVGEAIKCMAESELRVSFHIITSDKQFFTGSVVRFGQGNKTVDLVCYAKTSLNLVPVRVAVRNIKIHDHFTTQACDDVQIEDCYANYFKYVDESDSFIRISLAHHSELCSDAYVQTFDCVRLLLPCTMSSRNIGVLQSYVHLCEKNYLEHRKHFLSVPLNWDCRRMYLQQLGTVLHFNKLDKIAKVTGFIRSKPPRLTDIFRSFCIDLANTVNIYCSSVAVQVFGSFEASVWHAEFFEKLRLLRVNDEEALKDLKKRLRFLKKNEDMCDYNYLNAAQKEACADMERCAGLWRELLSITDLGIVFIPNITEFNAKICSLKDSFVKSCAEKYLDHCAPKTKVVLRPLYLLHRLLCYDYRTAYEANRVCYEGVYDQMYTRYELNCSMEVFFHFEQMYDNLDENKRARLLPEEETQLCNIAINYLDCLQSFFSKTCGINAALLQRILSRVIFSEAFKDLYCHFVFSHKSQFLVGIIVSVSSSFHYSAYVCCIVSFVMSLQTI